MPVQDFALDELGNYRIQIHWTTRSEPVTVLLNGSIIDTLATPEERQAGRDVTLPDGSLLYVQFANDQPYVSRNGLPPAILPAIPSYEAPVSQRKRGGCLTAWIVLNFMVISWFTFLDFLQIFLAPTIGDSHILVFLIVFVLVGIVGIVGLATLLAWKKWGFFLVAGYVVLSILLPFSFGIGNIFIFWPLIGLVILYVWLQRSGAWEHLTWAQTYVHGSNVSRETLPHGKWCMIVPSW